MRQNLEISVNAVKLAAWHYPPANTEGLRPIIVMSHGLGAVKEMGLPGYAERFAAAGFHVLVHDHRNCGGSTGEPRLHFDPWLQINDMRDVITFAESLPGVDANRIGIWGTSWSGGHVLVLAATDRRVKCVVAQVPTISGLRNTQRSVPADRMASLLSDIYEERRKVAKGAQPSLVRISAEGSDGDAWSSKAGAGTPYRKEMTLLTRELRMAYEPGIYLPMIAPTPLLMVVAKSDVRCPIDDQLGAFNQAREPKQIEILEGGHYSFYDEKLAEASTAACAWFSRHLRP